MSSKKSHQRKPAADVPSLPDRLRLAISTLGFERIIDFIQAQNIKQSTLYAVLNGQTRDPGVSILKKLHDAGINLNWLVSGEGDILLENPQRGTGAAPERAPYGISEEIGALHGRIKDAMEQMSGAYEQVSRLRSYAADLEQLPPEKQAMFHSMVRALLQSIREESSGGAKSAK